MTTYCESCTNSSIGQLYKCTTCVRHIICKKCFIDLIVHGAVKHLFERVYNEDARISGTEVIKKNHWKWTNRESNYGAPGYVNHIFDTGKTGRSVAYILWMDNTTNDYRVGDAGQMDLTCIIAATGGTFFESHLPILVENPVLPDSDLYTSMKNFQRSLDASFGEQKVEKLILSLGETIGESSDEPTTQDPETSTDLLSLSQEHIQELENKVRNFEGQTTCAICLEAPKDMIFQCGHGVCEACSSHLNICHICRVPIATKIKIFLIS